MRKLDHVLVPWVIAAQFPLALVAHAETQSIFRCRGANGVVLYSDAPCGDGARLDIAPGRADPAAIDRLRRDEDAFRQRQLARDAAALEQRERALASREAELRRVEESQRAEREANAVSYPAYWGWGYWAWPPLRPVKPPHPPPPRKPSFVPAR